MPPSQRPAARRRRAAPRRLAGPLLAALLAAVVVTGCGSSGTSSTGSSPASASSPSSSSTSSSSTSSSSTSSSSTSASTSSKPQIGFEGVAIEQGPLLASPSTTGTATVGGVHCGPTEQLAYHIHIHLAVYVNGQLRALPGGVGIPGSTVQQSSEGPVATGGQCIYWLHTHAPDGIIHVESPTRRIYTLGEFFAIWRQPLTRHDVAGNQGVVGALVNGRPWTGNPAAIPLLPHSVIQLNVGSPVPFHPMSWRGLQL